MSYDRLTAQEAWTRITKSPGAQWEEAAKRLTGAPVPVHFQRTFKIERSHEVFCIGSCFARNIEEHLLYRGIPVLSKGIHSPREEWPGRPNGLVNKFTTHSMLQELQWLVAPPADPGAVLVEADSGWLDLQLAPGVQPVTRDRALARRAYLSGDYFPRIARADVVIVTLGLNEVWRDATHDIWLNSGPRYFSVRRQPNRYELHITDVADNQGALERFYAILKQLNPGSRLIVTVSPVPMTATFSGDDVLVANTRSKCTLRAAAEAFCRAHADVAYFPSFEMITLGAQSANYAPDRLHVLDEAVGKVTGAFIQAYLGDSPPLDPDFLEIPYLAANPDVDAQVRSGDLDSGFAHWLRVGRAEGRPLHPAVATNQMIGMGLDKSRD
ncbi:MAG: GSCFA domain-containing protein [Chromatiales bacterium]|nr:GSCFA domain-containing protein [Chromatiales bacterium]